MKKMFLSVPTLIAVQITSPLLGGGGGDFKPIAGIGPTGLLLGFGALTAETTT